jgi:hypothetical protein
VIGESVRTLSCAGYSGGTLGDCSRVTSLWAVRRQQLAVESWSLYRGGELKDAARMLSGAIGRRAQLPLSLPGGLHEIGVVEKCGDVGVEDGVVGVELDMS